MKSKRTPENVALPGFVNDELARILGQGIHTRLMVERVEIIKQCFASRDKVPLLEVVTKLFPDNNLKTASVNFRKFKERINNFLDANHAMIKLESSPGTAGLDAKFAWFENKDPEFAALNAGVEHTLVLAGAAHETISRGLDTCIDTDVLMRRIPCLTFAEQVDQFGRDLFPGAWEAMSEREREFYYKLSAKLEPIRQISPHPDTPRETVGFELLALDAAGRSFTSIEHYIKRKNYDPAVHFALMIYVAMLTIRYLRTVLPLRDPDIHRDCIFFTINLTPYMVGHPHLHEIFRRVLPLAPDGFMLEVSEKLLGDKVDELLNFQEAFGFKLALDDLDQLDPGVRRALENHVAMTKVGYRKANSLLDRHEQEPDRVLAELRRFKLQGRPLVVEAMDEDLRQAFLYRAWNPEWGTLYVQGRDLAPGPVFRRHLTALSQFHIRGGGYVLSAEERSPVYRDVFEGTCEGLEIDSHREVDDTLRITFHSRDFPERRFTIMALAACPAPDAAESVAELAADADFMITPPPAPVLCGRRPWVPLAALGRFLAAAGRALARGAELPAGQEADVPAFMALWAPEQAPVSVAGNMTRTDGLDLLLRWSGIICDTEEVRDHALPRTLALLGDTGSGKSTLVRRLAAALWADRANAGTPLPVLLDAARLADPLRAALAAGQTPDLEQCVAWAAASYGAAHVDARAVLAAVHGGRAVVLCDGFDILGVPLTRSRSMALMRNLRAAVAHQGRLLVAARTHYFLDAMDEEERLLAGEGFAVTHQRASGKVISTYMEPLNPEQIAALAARRLGRQGAEEFLAALEASPALRDLAARPSLLHALHALWSEDPGFVRAHAALFEALIKAWLMRDDFTHLLRPDLKVRFMEVLAGKLREETDRSLHAEGLFRWLHKRLGEEFPAVESVAESERLDNDLRTATFLTRTPGGYYGMAHPALLDYFAARALARGLSDGDPETLEAPGLTPHILALAAGTALRPPFRADVAEATARILMHSSRNPAAVDNANAFLAALKNA